MAQLEARPALAQGGSLSRSQMLAVVLLRWRIFRNGLRRKGGAAELVGRILLAPLLVSLLILPALGAGFFSWYAIHEGRPQQLAWVFWAMFLLAQLVNINLGQPGTNFDPLELNRFPITLRTYIVVRLCFGIVSPANLAVLLMSVAAFVGVTLAHSRLWPWAVPVLGVFALGNIVFTRMVFAWVDRWLSTRRAREVFTVVIFAGSLLVQYLNVTYNPGFQGHRRARTSTAQTRRAQQVIRVAQPYLAWLPPGLAAGAIRDAAQRDTARYLEQTALCAAFGGLFLAVFAQRMRTEYRGENLSEAAHAVSAPFAPSATHAGTMPLSAAVADTGQRRGVLPSSLGPMLRKEVLLLRRNTGLLYGVVAPMVMVFLFAGRLSLRGDSSWVLFGACVYALLGIAPMTYNSFGLEGAGAQLYFLAPVPLREVFLAKNLTSFALAFVEVCAVLSIVAYVGVRPTVTDVVFALLWAVAALLLNTTVGNLRSISAPKRVNPGRSMNRAQSQVSAWMSIGLLVGSAALGAGLRWAAMFFGQPWIAPVCVLLLAGGAVAVYVAGLRGIGEYALAHRETLLEELGRKA